MLTEWLCNGLQIRVARFNSEARLLFFCPGGGIGRHKGLKIPQLLLYEFKSRPGYFHKNIFNIIFYDVKKMIIT